MKKILIFYGSYGGGHLSAAKSIKEYIESNYKDIDIKLVDCMEYINKHLNKLLVDAYNEAAKKFPWAWKTAYQLSNDGIITTNAVKTSNEIFSIKLNKLLQDFNPDLIISTHPFGTQMCGVLKKRGKIQCKLATVLTDFHVHGQWLIFHEFCDYFFVSNNQMKEDMIAYGVEENKIYVTGIPVSAKFSQEFNRLEICNFFNLDENKKVILFFAGGEFGLGNKNTLIMCKVLVRLFPDWQVVAISGKNPKMFKKFKDIIDSRDASNRVKLFEFTDKVPELMAISECIVTKPGGLTTTESLTSKLPIIIINPIPGQEEENAEFLENSGAAVWIKKNDNIVRIMKKLLKDEEKIHQMSISSSKLAKPHSTQEICETLLQKEKP